MNICFPISLLESGPFRSRSVLMKTEGSSVGGGFVWGLMHQAMQVITLLGANTLCGQKWRLISECYLSGTERLWKRNNGKHGKCYSSHARKPAVKSIRDPDALLTWLTQAHVRLDQKKR